MTRKWYFARLSGPKVGKILIHEPIGSDWYGEEGTTAKSFIDEVDALGDDLETLNIHINSPGGNVYAGLAIYNYLKRHKAEVVVTVDGIAASIASVIAMAGDVVEMPSNTSLFIHNPYSYAAGDAKKFRKTAEDLDAMRDSLAGIYMTKVSISRPELIKLMDAETLLTADECLEKGFADKVKPEINMATKMPAAKAVATARLVAQFEKPTEEQIGAARQHIQDMTRPAIGIYPTKIYEARNKGAFSRTV